VDALQTRSYDQLLQRLDRGLKRRDAKVDSTIVVLLAMGFSCFRKVSETHWTELHASRGEENYQFGAKLSFSDLDSRFSDGFRLVGDRYAIGRRKAASVNPAEELLSKREKEVHRLTEEGCSLKETSSILGISERTVEKHRERICKKLRSTAREPTGQESKSQGMHQ